MFIFHIISVNIYDMRKKTHEKFIEEMKNKNPNIEILGTYVGAQTKIKCKCLIDGYIWDVKPANLLSGRGCPKCKANKLKKTHKEFIEELKAKNPNIDILGEYINNKTKIKCKCLIDGHIWEPTPETILRGQGCPKCAGTLKKTHEEFIEEIKNINPNIEILGKYINANTKIKCECLVDGNVWEVTPSSILCGYGCPKCHSSKGERAIEIYCKNNYLQYKTQYRIDKCRNKLPLPFDFALFNKNKLVALFEYQGEQHYECIEYFGGEKALKYTQNNDNIKRNYCLSNNIPLIEIPYWIDDVEGYLEEQMDKVINKPLQLSLI